MNLLELKGNLCSYDKRNPWYEIDEDEQDAPRTDCSCDNCFYGRTPLALEIIKLSQVVD